MKILKEKLKEVDPADIFGLYGGKKLNYSFSDFISDIKADLKTREQDRQIKLAKKAEKQKEKEKERRAQDLFNKRMDEYFKTRNNRSMFSDEYYKDFLTKGETYDYNNVMDDLESEGYAVDE